MDRLWLNKRKYLKKSATRQWVLLNFMKITVGFAVCHWNVIDDYSVQFNSLYLPMCLTTAKQRQLQTSTKTNSAKTNNII
jgi:hypothetical protein